jgi:hypothetical protein
MLSGHIVRIATCYSLDGPGFESRWGDFLQTDFGAHTASCTLGTKSLSPGVMWPGHGVGQPNSSSAEVKERAELLLAFRGYYRVNFTFHLVIGRINVACMYALMMTNDISQLQRASFFRRTCTIY